MPGPSGKTMELKEDPGTEGDWKKVAVSPDYMGWTSGGDNGIVPSRGGEDYDGEVAPAEERAEAPPTQTPVRRTQ